MLFGYKPYVYFVPVKNKYRDREGRKARAEEVDVIFAVHNPKFFKNSWLREMLTIQRKPLTADVFLELLRLFCPASLAAL